MVPGMTFQNTNQKLKNKPTMFTCIQSENGKELIGNALMEKPERTDSYEVPGGSELYQSDLDDYKDHISSLPRFPVSIDHSEQFVVGNGYEIDIDFVVDEGIFISKGRRVLGAVALPVTSKPVEEGEVWEEVKDIFSKYPITEYTSRSIIEILKLKYTISKKAK